MIDPIEERFKQIDARLSSIIGDIIPMGNVIEKLTKYGLTDKEAKAWLKREPKYSKRRVTSFYRFDQTNGEVTEPFPPNLKTTNFQV